MQISKIEIELTLDCKRLERKKIIVFIVIFGGFYFSWILYPLNLSPSISRFSKPSSWLRQGSQREGEKDHIRLRTEMDRIIKALLIPVLVVAVAVKMNDESLLQLTRNQSSRIDCGRNRI